MIYFTTLCCFLLDLSDMWWLRDQMKAWISFGVSNHKILESLEIREKFLLVRSARLEWLFHLRSPILRRTQRVMKMGCQLNKVCVEENCVWVVCHPRTENLRPVGVATTNERTRKDADGKISDDKTNLTTEGERWGAVCLKIQYRNVTYKYNTI